MGPLFLFKGLVPELHTSSESEASETSSFNLFGEDEEEESDSSEYDDEDPSVSVPVLNSIGNSSFSLTPFLLLCEIQNISIHAGLFRIISLYSKCYYKPVQTYP